MKETSFTPRLRAIMWCTVPVVSYYRQHGRCVCVPSLLPSHCYQADSTLGQQTLLGILPLPPSPLLLVVDQTAQTVAAPSRVQCNSKLKYSLISYHTWSEFQHVSSRSSNMNFFPNWRESLLSTELTLSAREQIQLYLHLIV